MRQFCPKLVFGINIVDGITNVWDLLYIGI